MSKMSDDAVIKAIEEICDKMVEEKYDFSQELGEIKKTIREKFYDIHGQIATTRPKLLILIGKVVEKYVTPTEEKE